MPKLLFTLFVFSNCMLLRAQAGFPDVIRLNQLQKTDLNGARKSAEKILRSIPSKKSAHYHEIRIQLASTLIKLTEIDTAWLIITEVPIEKLPNEALKVEQLIQMGEIQELQGNSDRSIYYYLKAIDIAKKSRLTKELGTSYNRIGASYMSRGDLARARRYFFESLSQKKGIRDSIGIATTYNNLGTYFKKLGELDSANMYYEKCVNIRLKLHDSIGLSFVYLNQAILEQVQGNRNKAIEIYQNVMDLAKKNGDNETHVLAKTNIGLAHYFQGEYNRAEPILLEALDFSLKHNEKSSLSSIYQALSLINEKKGDASGVLRYRKLFHNHYVETFNLEKEKEVNRLQIKFDSKEKDLKINKLEQQRIVNELNMQRKALRDSKVFFWFYLALSTLILVVIFVLIIYFRKKTFSKKQHLLLVEREILLKEVHHRVKNNLQIVSSLLSLQGESNLDTDPKELLRQSQNRIQSIAIIHEKLYQSASLANINLSAYLLQLVEHLVESYDLEQLGITIETDIAPIQLDLDQIVPCGLIVNELITNSIKHAFHQGGVIWIGALLNDGEIRLEIKDNGKGLPADFSLLRSSSLGLKLATGLAKQLKGTLKSIESPVGVHFQLIINLSA